MTELLRKLLAPQSEGEAAQVLKAMDDFDCNIDVVDGIVRWKNSLRVPPQMHLDLWEHVGRGFDAAASSATRESELAAFLVDAQEALGLESPPRALSELANYCSATQPVLFGMGRKSVDKFSDCHVEDGVARWTTNNRAPHLDMLQLWAYCNKPFHYSKTVQTQQREQSEFLSEIRKNDANRPISAEEAFEMRAAFGGGVTVVNVITGRRHRT